MSISFFISITYKIKLFIKENIFSYAGISRSSSCVIAYLMKERGFSYSGALYSVRLKRPIICPNVGF